MKVFSFKLKGIRGRDGIQADVLKPVFDKKLGITVNDRAKNYTRPIAVPSELYRKIQGVKVYFLVLLGYWREEWSSLNMIGENGELKRNDNTIPGYGGLVHTWDNSWVTDIKFDESSGTFTIGGVMRVVGEKEMLLKTVEISETDSGVFTDYYKCVDVIQDIIDNVATYLKDDRIHMMNPKEFLLGLYDRDPVEKDRINDQNERDNFEEMIRKLESKNYVVFNPTDEMPALEAGSVIEKETESFREDDFEDEAMDEEDEPVSSVQETEEEEYDTDIDFEAAVIDEKEEDVEEDDDFSENNDEPIYEDDFRNDDEPAENDSDIYMSPDEQEDYTKEDELFG